MMDGEDEDVLDMSEQTNRPKDDALHQQRVQAWHPILDPVWVIVTLFYLGVILVPTGKVVCVLSLFISRVCDVYVCLFGFFENCIAPIAQNFLRTPLTDSPFVPLISLQHNISLLVFLIHFIFSSSFFFKFFPLSGFKIDSLQDEVTELKLVYDKYGVDKPACGIRNTFNAGKVCEVSFTTTKDMKPPIFVYYELTNFHQNHRSYAQSRNDFQLHGDVNPRGKDLCKPLNRLGDITLNPCGMIANTFFNDIFVLTSGQDMNDIPLEMIETGIAWQSDLDWIFSQPTGFRSEVCPNNVGCTKSCCDGDDWSCDEPWIDPKDGTCYRFFYPQDNTTQYLYETYPDIISPLEGVTNEHFVVWMRVALQPTFRKLYGWFDQPIAKGTKLTFNITSNYVVTRFRGSKALLITTNNIFGGRNIYLGPSFIYVGYFCFAAGILFSLKHFIRPRKLADRSYLHFKTD